MRVAIIDDIGQFERLKGRWDAVYSADPHAMVFSSWAWLRGWIETTSSRWIVLAAGEPMHVAFMALALDTDKDSTGRLYMAGSPISDHTGFVCLPEYAEAAAAAFASAIKQRLKWKVFYMSNVSDPRAELFAGFFGPRHFDVQRLNSTCCPCIALPDNWQEYLKSITPSLRKGINRSFRRVINVNGFRMTHASDDDIDTQIDTALALYRMRWREQPEHVLNTMRAVFRRCHEDGYLWLSILWDDSTPVVAHVGFMDREKGIFSSYIGGWDSRYTALSPGTVMDGYSIRHAVENEFRFFDFGGGDEGYKFLFGAQTRYNSNIRISRKGPFFWLKKKLPSKAKNFVKTLFSSGKRDNHV